MKLSNRIFALLGLAAALVGCRPEEADIDLPKIKVDGPALTFDAETKLASCELDQQLVNIPLTVNANRDWAAEINWDDEEVPWIAVTPDHGVASDRPQDVTLTVLNNAGFNRNKRVKFSIGYDYKSIDISQTGERGEEIVGTLDNPFSVAGVVKYVKKLGADVQSSSGVYVKGKISRIDDGSNFASSGTYGNATFYISDDGGTDSEQFYCYRVLYLGNKKWTSKDPDIKVGDDVIIYGQVVNYKGNTPETVQGTAFVYEHNGVNRGTDEGGGGGGEEGTPSGTGTQADPYNVAAARAAVKDLTWTANDNYEKTGTVYVKGKISRIADNGTFGQSGTYGNATFWISDDGSEGAELYAYRILYLGNKKYTSGTDIKVGDEVVICGELMNYRGNTPETVANSAYLFSLNGEGGGGGGEEPPTGGEPKGTGTLDDPFNPLGAANAVKDLTWTINTEYDKTGEVYIKGKISRIADKGTFTEGGTYGNASFYISEDGEQKDEFYCFRILYLGNVKYTEGTDIKVGDEVIVCGKLMNYKGNTPETVAGEAYLYSLNGKTDGSGDTPSDVKAVTIAEFNAAPESDKQVYELVGTIGGTINTTYGNFDLTDESGTVYVYGLTATELGYGEKNDKSFATLGLVEGDKIKIHGYRGSFNDKIEVVYAWFIEKVTGGDTPSEVKAVTIAEFNAAPESDKQVYELVGTIGGSINTTYGNFDLTDETGTVYVYGLTATELGYGEKNDKSFGSLGLVEGDKIKIHGYRGSFNDKIEVVYAWFIEKVTGGDTPTEVKAVTIADFNAAPESDKQVYELVGTIGGTINTTYGNFDLTDETGTVYVYGLTATELGYGQKNDKSYATLGLVEGDKIKIHGYRGSFNDKIEVVYAWFIEKVAGGGDTPSGNGSGTLADPYTPAGAINAVKDLTWTNNTTYDKTEKVYVKGKISRIASKGTYGESGTYGNASYWISADGTENEEFQIFRSLYFNGEKYTEGTDIKVGDEVVVYGALMNYKGNTPETVAGENWLYSLNGATDGGSSTPAAGDGTVTNPYSVPEAINAVKDLTWTNNTTYDKTEKVYLKGKISRIASKGTYGESGTYGNASYWISADGTENEEFQIFRSLYFNGEKYTEGTDIKVDDEVVVYGALMNYKGNTPETVAGENWLYSLNGKTDGGSGGGGDTPAGTSVSFATNSSAQTWAAETDGTYGSGFASTTQGVKIAYYKHQSNTDPVAPNENHVRVYKNSALSISSTEVKKIKKIVIGTAPNSGTSSYCFDMTGLEGGADATCDKDALTVTWNGSATKVVLFAKNGQVRMEKITVEFE